MDPSAKELIVPRGLPQEAPLRLNIEGLLAVESRIQEISFVNTMKAPELMSTFNAAYCDISEMISKVQYEFEVAKTHTNKCRAIATLDRIPTILKDKGLITAKSPAGSEDLRQAALELDPDYQAAKENEIKLKCILALMEAKLKGVEMAYTAVKKVYSDPSQYHSRSLAVDSQQQSDNKFFK